MASGYHAGLKFPELIADFDTPDDLPQQGDRVRFELTLHGRRLVGIQGSAFGPLNRLLMMVRDIPDGESLVRVLLPQFPDAELMLGQLVDRGLVARLVIPAAQMAGKVVRPPLGEAPERQSLVVDSIQEAEQAEAAATARPKAGAPAQSAMLSVAATRLLASLPSKLSLAALIEQYPHVLNRLADVWRQAPVLEREFNELLMDQRGGRQGFPFNIVLELTALRDFYFRFVQPKRSSAWDVNNSSYWR
jgi:hypothetical protein